MKSKLASNRRAFLRTIGRIGHRPAVSGGSRRALGVGPDPAEAAPIRLIHLHRERRRAGVPGASPRSSGRREVGPLTTAGMQAFAGDRATGLLADYADRLLIVRGINYPFQQPRLRSRAGPDAVPHRRAAEGDAQNAVVHGHLGRHAHCQRAEPRGRRAADPLRGLKGGYIDEKLSFSAAASGASRRGQPLERLPAARWAWCSRRPAARPAKRSASRCAGAASTTSCATSCNALLNRLR